MQWTENQQDQQKPGFTDLLKSLSNGLGQLLRQEVEFAKVEVSKQMTHARRGIILLATGAVFGFCAVLVLLSAAVAALALVVPLWLSAIIIGVAIGLIGVILLGLARRELTAERLKPQKTIDLVKEDIAWMRNQMS